ncbi:terpenoid cyclases/protein prenyltransferase alpha-alpha toroid [Suillus bovinus]|uniref:terpenoid cyclases/protein prenyltransferase alpha-alpha toroid n=1 Tax=Suillus bovinus TaxID=48563 RepID=UPI001B882977|nr:terpenoid cyclases/protein prenyltransferase alpha-alpha toroid [Suillus bovinus]KAG2136559.1 terpenoid cyclases/protein prenyltransferase alpha-alpha toroid [Suillus bovinus]
MSQPRRSPHDSYETETTDHQTETETILLKHLPLNPDSPSPLQRDAHLQFLIRNLIQGFPSRYISQDASQPWLLYWTLQSFSIMGVALDPDNKQKAIDTIMALQHPEGGFGGGPGQAAHLLPTYAAVCALAIVGRPGPGGGWDQIDREKMYKFFLSVKQPDGAFLVAHHAEVDVRGTYCLLVTAHLLNMLTPELLEGIPGFIMSCQTYEGGFSCASQPYFSPEPDGPPTLLDSPRPPLGEAHGGYTFCSLASWVMLQPYLALQKPSLQRSSLNFKTLLRWLVQMQGSETELGGFRGRTNKLVDGCYSWWVGGCFALLSSLGIVGAHGRDDGHESSRANEEDESWDDIDDSVWDRAALQRYILCAGQHPAGGLRDKPPKPADSYHTLYCLAGLSSAQHNVFLSSTRRDAIVRNWKTPAESMHEQLRQACFLHSLSWTEEEGASRILGAQNNRMNATHPVFNLTMTHTENIMVHFYKQTVPSRPRKT